MFPFRKLLRLATTTFLVCFITVTCMQILLSFLRSIPETDQTTFSLYISGAINSRSPCRQTTQFFTDDSRSLKSRFAKEFELKDRLAALSAEEVKKCAENYYRNVTIQWAERRLLPPSKPLYNEQCLQYWNQTYNTLVSVVISYHNELAVLIMRTLTTIMHRTPLNNLLEIILIDDYSSLNVTQEVLDYASQQRMPVRHLRNSEKLGIAGSRLRGIQEAKGVVVVILDNHMEVSVGWLEPLLNILVTRPGAVAVPVLHMIQETEYKLLSNKVIQPYIVQPRQGWGHIVMQMYWNQVDDSRQVWEPIPSASLMGGGLAAARSTLLEFYPTRVVNSSWGVENNRLSFRAWMCGQGVWVSPCSQILHPNGNDPSLFRYFRDSYHLRKEVDLESVAEAINFADDDVLKEIILNKVAASADELNKIRDVSIQIKKKFDSKQRSCKTLSWYLKDIYYNYLTWERDQFDQVGEIRSLENTKMCLEVFDRKVEMYYCRSKPPELGDNHHFGFTKNHIVRSSFLEDFCWYSNSDKEGQGVTLYSCHIVTPVEGQPGGSQNFLYDEKSRQIKHPSTGRCLEYFKDSSPVLMKCNSDKISQKWEIILSTWF